MLKGVAQPSSEPRVTGLWLKRCPPVERAQRPEGPAWVLVVCLRAGSDESVARLGLSSDDVALRVDRLLSAMQMGSRGAARALYACLRLERERGGRHQGDDPIWEVVLRHLATAAAFHPAESKDGAR
jgi:hypothetical protein